ncbi:MAG: amidohydrolase 2, partial [Rhodoferax sp.]|nr:amidohydrolase 2 [Rhodoferax sp.]
NTLLKDRMLFGSDYPLITPERWMKDFAEAGFKPEVHEPILKTNAMRLLKLGVIETPLAQEPVA